MVTLNDIKNLVNLDARGLVDIFKRSGYTDVKIVKAEFKFINRAGTFVYETVGIDESDPEEYVFGRAYVKYDWDTNRLVAEY